MAQFSRRFARRGFSLIELAIVVLILGIIAAIVVPRFQRASLEARKQKQEQAEAMGPKLDPAPNLATPEELQVVTPEEIIRRLEQQLETHEKEAAMLREQIKQLKAELEAKSVQPSVFRTENDDEGRDTGINSYNDSNSNN